MVNIVFTRLIVQVPLPGGGEDRSTAHQDFLCKVYSYLQWRANQSLPGGI